MMTVLWRKIMGEVPHNNIKEKCTSISEHSSTVDRIQHHNLDNSNVSNANKLHGSSSESIIATSIPPNTKKKKKLHKHRGQEKVAQTTGQKNDDSVQTTKTQKNGRKEANRRKRMIILDTLQALQTTIFPWRILSSDKSLYLNNKTIVTRMKLLSPRPEITIQRTLKTHPICLIPRNRT